VWTPLLPPAGRSRDRLKLSYAHRWGPAFPEGGDGKGSFEAWGGKVLSLSPRKVRHRANIVGAAIALALANGSGVDRLEARTRDPEAHLVSASAAARAEALPPWAPCGEPTRLQQGSRPLQAPPGWGRAG